MGSGDRSERIRTYNFPQGRLTDHRIGLTLYRLAEVMAGDLDEIIDALVAEDQAREAGRKRAVRAAEALAAAVGRLRAAGVPDPARDARRLLAHALGVAPERLALALSEPLEAGAAARFEAAVARRAARQPVSHIVGARAFYGRRLPGDPRRARPPPRDRGAGRAGARAALCPRARPRHRERAASC